MGLQSDLSDVSSESVLIIAVVLIGKSVSYLNSLLYTILRLFSPRLNQNRSNSSDEPLYDVVGSGLAGIVLLCEQLNLNRACSYPNKSELSDCVVCLNKLGEGENVRRLACRHVFHEDCLGRWLSEMNFSCPLCRAQLVKEERVDCTRRRVAGDLLAWFPVH